MGRWAEGETKDEKDDIYVTLPAVETAFYFSEAALINLIICRSMRLSVNRT